MKIYQSFSSEETKRLGEKLARKIAKGGARKGAKNALVFGLVGELGSGKTTFVQGFFRGLGIKRAASPTFIIIRRTALKNKKFRNVFHVDAYRIKKPKELSVLGFRDILKNPQNIVIIEWAEKIKRILPKKVFWLRFKHGKKENERKISREGAVMARLGV